MLDNQMSPLIGASLNTQLQALDVRKFVFTYEKGKWTDILPEKNCLTRSSLLELLR